MKQTKLKFRVATQADLGAFYGQALPRKVKAWVAVNGDDRPLGVGGYFLADGAAVAFTDHREGMTKRDRVCAGRFLVDKLKGLDMEVAAIAGSNGDTALKHFGFEPWDQFDQLTPEKDKDS